MRKRLLIALTVVACLLIAIPAVAATDVADPVLAKLDAVLTSLAGMQDESKALAKRVEALEKQVAEIHEAVVPAEGAQPEVLMIKSDGITPISVAEADDWGKFELLELREEGNDVVARVRIRTSDKLSRTYAYKFILESGKSRFDPDLDGQQVPPGTTREYTVTYKKAAGTLTRDGYISVQYLSGWYYEAARIYLAPQK